MRVSLLGDGQRLAEVIDRSLYRVSFALIVLDDEDCAEHSVGCGDVQEDWFFRRRCDEDGWSRQNMLEVNECCLSFFHRLEFVCLLHQLVERECLFTQRTNESSERCDSTGQALYFSDFGWRGHR